jgi:hypothetical protein
MGKGIAAVDLGGARGYAIACESSNRLAEPVEILAETEVETRPGVGDQSHGLITSSAQPAKSAALWVAMSASSRVGGVLPAGWSANISGLQRTSSFSSRQQGHCVQKLRPGNRCREITVLSCDHIQLMVDGVGRSDSDRTFASKDFI